MRNCHSAHLIVYNPHKAFHLQKIMSYLIVVIEVNNNYISQLLCPKGSQRTSHGQFVEYMDNAIANAGGKGEALVYGASYSGVQGSMSFMYPELGRSFVLRFNYGTGGEAHASVSPEEISAGGSAVLCQCSEPKFEGLTMKITLNFVDPKI